MISCEVLLVIVGGLHTCILGMESCPPTLSPYRRCSPLGSPSSKRVCPAGVFPLRFRSSGSLPVQDPSPVFEIQRWDYELHQPSENMAVLSQKSVFENVALSKQNI